MTNYDLTRAYILKQTYHVLIEGKAVVPSGVPPKPSKRHAGIRDHTLESLSVNAYWIGVTVEKAHGDKEKPDA